MEAGDPKKQNGKARYRVSHPFLEGNSEKRRSQEKKDGNRKKGNRVVSESKRGGHSTAGKGPHKYQTQDTQRARSAS